MFRFVAAFALLSAASAHVFTRWKGGAGIWHDRDEALPQIPRKTRQIRRSSDAVQFTITPTVVENGGIALLSWSSAELEPNVSFVAVYCPSTAKDDDYVDHFQLRSTVGSRPVGPLTNMRCDFQFRLFRDSNTKLATSERVTFSGGGASQPLQGHLSLTNHPDEMRVMWVSDNKKTPTVAYQVFQSSSSSSYQVYKTGSSTTYSASDMCDAPATRVSAQYYRDPGFIHDVLLTNLLPKTKYRYRFGDGTNWSDWYTFTSAPSVGSQSSQVNMFVFGDLGEWRDAADPAPGGRAYTTMERIENDWKTSDVTYDLLLHVGDVSYARGHGYLWEQFGNLVAPTATRIPYHVCVGNHEYDHRSGSNKDPSGSRGLWHPSWGNYGNDSSGECAVPTVKRFHMPDNGNGLFWYSHDYGNVHFTWISTEHNFTSGSPMYTWLENDLASVDRSRTPWLLVMAHRPMYCSGMQKNDDNVKVQVGQRDAYEDLLHKYNVDLFITGHYHLYERTCPVYKERCFGSSDDARSTIHLVLGMAGAEHGINSWTDDAWSVARSTDYGYARMFVANRTHLRLQIVANKDGQVSDAVWIKSNHSWSGSNGGGEIIAKSNIATLCCIFIFYFIYS